MRTKSIAKPYDNGKTRDTRLILLNHVLKIIFRSSTFKENFHKTQTPVTLVFVTATITTAITNSYPKSIVLFCHNLLHKLEGGGGNHYIGSQFSLLMLLPIGLIPKCWMMLGNRCGLQNSFWKFQMICEEICRCVVTALLVVIFCIRRSNCFTVKKLVHGVQFLL